MTIENKIRAKLGLSESSQDFETVLNKHGYKHVGKYDSDGVPHVYRNEPKQEFVTLHDGDYWQHGRIGNTPGNYDNYSNDGFNFINLDKLLCSRKK